MNPLKRLLLPYARRKLLLREISGAYTNTLEEWFQAQIRLKFVKESKFRSYIEKESLNEIEKSDVEKYKLFKLREVLNYVYEKSPFYKGLFRKINLNPEDIKSFQDFAKMPPTESEEISENPYRFLCVPQGEILRGFTVEEFFGDERRIFFTESELKEIVEVIAVGLKIIDMRAGNAVQIMYPWEPEWGLPDLVKHGVRLGNGRPVVSGALKFEKQIDEIKKNEPSLIIGPNPYLREFTAWAKDRFDLKQLKVKGLILSRGCNFFPFDETIRKEMEEAWGCKVFDHYGITEASFALALECYEQNGLHLNEHDVYVEVIDPDSGETVNIGEEGELVFTTLNRRGMPLIRYRSKDIATLIDEPCECGAKLSRRIVGIKRKNDEEI